MEGNKENLYVVDQQRELRIQCLRQQNERLKRIHEEQELRIRDLDSAKRQLVIDLANKKAAYYKEMERRAGGK
jgi:hypothetical protein